jgi:polyhydroxyalkanoate synthase
MQLIQYAPSTETVLKRPLLIVPPWINKFYVLDLTPEKSFIKWCVDNGLTVFVISWVNPDARQAEMGFEEYMKLGPIAAIDAIEQATGEKQVNTIGYCVGGTLLAITLAYLAKKSDKRIASATLFTAQVDFTHAGDLKVFVDEEQLKAVEERMKERGYLEGKKMANAFNMLRSNDLIWGYVVNNYMLGKDPFPFDLLYWNADSTAMPAKVHGYYLQEFYIRNTFAKNLLEVRGEVITMADIKGPVYHVATKEDHIAPAASVYRGAKEMTGAEVRFVLSGSGHIAGVVNPPVLQKYQFWTNPDMSQPTLEDWLKGAEETPGSWWGDWDAWLKPRSGRQVNARSPGAMLGVIEPAPGSYVKVRFDSPDQ